MISKPVITETKFQVVSIETNKHIDVQVGLNADFKGEEFRSKQSSQTSAQCTMTNSNFLSQHCMIMLQLTAGNLNLTYKT